MKKIGLILGTILVMSSCESYPTPMSFPTYPTKTNTTNTATKEVSYDELVKTYVSEKAEVLNYLLNSESPTDPKTAITVENTSPCNIVITISGNNVLKKIPIASGKTGSALVLKNQNYQLSGKICNSNFKSNQYITSVTTLKVSQ